MFTGVRFNGKHSYNDYGLIMMQRPDIGMPTAKTIFVDIPGADGSLDLTEAVAGEVKYNNRTLEFKFGAMVERDKQADFKSRIMDDLHGQIMEVILDEDPEWFYRGRVSVEFEDIQSWRLGVTIRVDAEPYKQAVNETKIRFTSEDIDNYNEISLVENSSKVYYNSRFEFGTVDEPTGDFSLFDSVRIRWRSDSPRGNWGQNPVITVKDADGNTYEFTNYFLDLSAFIIPSALTTAGLDITRIVSIQVRYVGGCTIAAVINYGKKYVFQNDRMTVCPVWEVTSSVAVPVLVNGVRFDLQPGNYRNPELLLRRGDNDIFLYWGQNSPSKIVELITRKGRL